MIEAVRINPSLTPKVSVLMPVYNAAPFLGEAIETVLTQTFGDFEFIIVDDGSTDGSSDLVHSYAGQDARIHPIYQEHNQGIVKVLNIGLDACTGDFVARMDADDVALPDRLALQLQGLAKNPKLGALGGALTYIDESGKELGVIRHCTLQASRLAGNPLLHPTVMLRRSVLTATSVPLPGKVSLRRRLFLVAGNAAVCRNRRAG